MHPSNLESTSVRFRGTTVQPNYSAGLLTVMLSPEVPAEAQLSVEGGCEICQDKTLELVSYMVHTHSLAKRITAWRVRHDVWNLIGEKSLGTSSIGDQI